MNPLTASCFSMNGGIVFRSLGVGGGIGLQVARGKLNPGEVMRRYRRLPVHIFLVPQRAVEHPALAKTAHPTQRIVSSLVGDARLVHIGLRGVEAQQHPDLRTPQKSLNTKISSVCGNAAAAKQRTSGWPGTRKLGEAWSAWRGLGGRGEADGLPVCWQHPSVTSAQYRLTWSRDPHHETPSDEQHRSLHRYSPGLFPDLSPSSSMRAIRGDWAETSCGAAFRQTAVLSSPRNQYGRSPLLSVSIIKGPAGKASLLQFRKDGLEIHLPGTRCEIDLAPGNSMVAQRSIT